MTEAASYRILKPEDWDTDYWKPNTPYFHRPEPHQFLVDYYDKLFENKLGRVFLPLSGKSLDLLWLANKGHEVVGLEFSEIAIKTFFEENNVKYSTAKIGVFEVYKAINLPLSVYRGDFFNLDKEILGSFDAIWDRGGFTAIENERRPRYVDLLYSLLKPNAKMLLFSCFYDQGKYCGPPYASSQEYIKSLYGKYFQDEHLVNKVEARERFNLTEYQANLNLMSMK